MKKLLLPCLLTCSLIANAQTTINETDVTPGVGAALYFYAAEYQNPGVQGTNITWDFSALNVGVEYQAINVLGTNANYPNSDFEYQYSHSSGDPAYEYSTFVSSDNGEYNIDAIVTADGTMDYSDPELYSFFPLSYNSSMTDSYYAVINSQGLTAERTGSVTIQVDGEGTLILPDNTYTNVLRVHYYHQIDDIFQGQSIGATQTHIYAWYAAGVNGALLQFSQSTTLGESTYYGLVNSDGVLSNDEITDTEVFTVSPNPFATELTVSNLNESVEKIEVYDLTGKVVKTMTVENETDVVIATEDLQEGMYILKAYGREGEVLDTQKVVKQ